MRHRGVSEIASSLCLVTFRVDFLLLLLFLLFIVTFNMDGKQNVKPRGPQMQPESTLIFSEAIIY